MQYIAKSKSNVWQNFERNQASRCWGTLRRNLATLATFNRHPFNKKEYVSQWMGNVWQNFERNWVEIS